MRLLPLIVLILMLPLRLFCQEPQISVVSVRGPINPVTADYLKKNLDAAGSRGDRLLLVEMDTPGGLDSAMREAVQAIFASSVPVAVYVTPSGARAASAGAVIGLAADILAMAPGTNIGAAHPVTVGGDKPDKVMEAKIVNDAEAYLDGIQKARPQCRDRQENGAGKRIAHLRGGFAGKGDRPDRGGPAGTAGQAGGVQSGAGGQGDGAAPDRCPGHHP